MEDYSIEKIVPNTANNDISNIINDEKKSEDSNINNIKENEEKNKNEEEEKNESKEIKNNIENEESNNYTSEVSETISQKKNESKGNKSKEFNIYSKIDDIQKELQEITKKIEQEKINLRICKERYDKKLKLYRELQGKPTQLSREEKEKERKIKKEREFFSPIKHKPGKNIELSENENKVKKQLNKNTITFQELTNDINSLELIHQDLKDEIFNMKKQKLLVINQRDIMKEENKNLEKEINQIKKKNEDSRNKIKNKELKETINKGIEQEKNFIKTRDELENEYHRIIEEYIKREAERKKEQIKKQQILLFGSDTKNLIKGANSKEIEKQIKLLSAEEISDRIPILDELINKWKYINKFKKHMVDKYIKNSEKVKETFDKIIKFSDVDDYSELPIIFRKNEEQFSNIDKFISQLEKEIKEKENNKKDLEIKISNLTNKRIENYESKENYIQEKKKKIEELNQLINNIEKEIEEKRNFFIQIQPISDEYLLKLESTYLSEFINDKVQIDKNKKYNESNISNFISNIEDYYKLILMFDEETYNKKDNEEREIDKLRNEMKFKLENFEKGKLLTKNLYTNMKVDASNGVDFDSIIKRSSELIMSQLTPMNYNLKNKNEKTMNKSSSMKIYNLRKLEPQN